MMLEKKLRDTRKIIMIKKKTKYYFPKNKIRKINLLIGINTARKTMRSSLGMTMETPVEKQLLTFGFLGEFLELGKAVKMKKNPESNKKEKDLIDAYKLNITALKKKIEDNKLMRENL